MNKGQWQTILAACQERASGLRARAATGKDELATLHLLDQNAVILAVMEEIEKA